MNWDHVQHEWRRYKVDAKQRWNKISEQQLNAVAGRREMLLGRIRDAYGISMSEAEKEVDEWQARLASHEPGWR